MQNRIKELRQKLGLTQEQLARVTEVRRETVVFLEQGKYNPSLLLAHRVAEELGTTIEKLFQFDE
jgi:putative transcriptional regulator